MDATRAMLGVPYILRRARRSPLEPQQESARRPQLMHTRRPTSFRPASEPLEDRALMSTGSLIYASPQVGVNSPVPPFAITGSASAPVEIFVASNAGPTPFLPVQDILVRTLTIDGRAVAGASIRANPVDTNGDGL